MRDEVPGLRRRETAAAVQLSADEQGPADACAKGQADKVIQAFCRAKGGFADGGGVDIVFKEDGNAKAAFEALLDLHAGIARYVVGGKDDAAAIRIHLPGGADRDGRQPFFL